MKSGRGRSDPGPFERYLHIVRHSVHSISRRSRRSRRTERPSEPAAVRSGSPLRVSWYGTQFMTVRVAGTGTILLAVGGDRLGPLLGFHAADLHRHVFGVLLRPAEVDGHGPLDRLQSA